MQGTTRQAHHYLQELVPAKVTHWQAVQPDGVYGPDTLFEYINGGAEVYKWLGLKLVLARKYTARGMPDIIVDIFDMGQSNSAFGAYRNDTREGKSAGVGAESEIGEASLAFWKGPFFVSIIAFDEGQEVTLAINSLAKHIDQRILVNSPPPSMLAILPPEVLKSRRFHFFHGHESLNAHYYLSSGNPLGLSPATNGLLAQMTATLEGTKHDYVLILVEYPAALQAMAAQSAAGQKILGAPKGELSARMPKGQYGRVAQIGRYLALVLDVPEGVDLNQLIAAIRTRISDLSKSQ